MIDTVATLPSDTHRGRWLSPALAAGELAVSERTVARRSARGELLRRTGDEGQIEIWVPLAEAEMWDEPSGPEPRDGAVGLEMRDESAEPAMRGASRPAAPPDRGAPLCDRLPMLRVAAPGDPSATAPGDRAIVADVAASDARALAAAGHHVTLADDPDHERHGLLRALAACVARYWAPVAALIGALPALLLVIAAVALAGRTLP